MIKPKLFTVLIVGFFLRMGVSEAYASQKTTEEKQTLSMQKKFDTPSIIPIEESISEFHLGKPAENALKRWNSKAKILKPSQFSSDVQELFANNIPEGTPMGAVADFNGDKVPDAAVLVESRGQLQLVGLISGKKGSYKAIRIYQQPIPEIPKKGPTKNGMKKSEEEKASVEAEEGLIEYLGVIPALNSQPKDLDGEQRFENEALRFETYLGPSMIFYYKNGRFYQWKHKK